MRRRLADRQTGVARAAALAATVVVLAGIALGIWSLQRADVDREQRPLDPPQAHSPPLQPSGQPATQTPATARFALPREATALPGEQTDPVVRGLVAEITAHPSVLQWLATDDLVRTFALAVANVAEGRSPSRQLPLLKPDTRFRVIRSAGGIFIDPAGYARYDPYAEAFNSIDPDGAAQLYSGLSPLLQDTYLELGYEGSFDDAMATAIVRLLETPIVDEGPVPLDPLPATYEFADPEFSELDRAQKHFLRMGPRNMRLVQEKLRELAPVFGLHSSVLP